MFKTIDSQDLKDLAPVAVGLCLIASPVIIGFGKMTLDMVRALF